MIRGENVCSGTSSTGAGALTLAACPAVIGGIDFDVFLKAKSFVNGNACPLTYIIIEYTDTTFATVSQLEKGVGVLTLGASITAASLTRTTVQETISAGAYSDQAPSAITIGTAANVLVFIGASSADLIGCTPYFDKALGDAQGLVVTGATANLNNTGYTVGDAPCDYYFKFKLDRAMYVRRATLRCGTGYSGTTGGTPVSTLYGRIYYVNSSAQPGKLAIDFGTFGTNPLNTGGTNISSGLLSPGKYLSPGEYFFDAYVTFSGATGTITTPALAGFTCNLPLAFSSTASKSSTIATGGSSTASDPANVTAYGLPVSLGNQALVPALWLKDS